MEIQDGQLNVSTCCAEFHKFIQIILNDKFQKRVDEADSSGIIEIL
jgi:hypothetical protein